MPVFELRAELESAITSPEQLHRFAARIHRRKYAPPLNDLLDAVQQVVDNKMSASSGVGPSEAVDWHAYLHHAVKHVLSEHLAQRTQNSSLFRTLVSTATRMFPGKTKKESSAQGRYYRKLIELSQQPPSQHNRTRDLSALSQLRAQVQKIVEEHKNLEPIFRNAFASLDIIVRNYHNMR